MGNSQQLVLFTQDLSCYENFTVLQYNYCRIVFLIIYSFPSNSPTVIPLSERILVT